MAWEIVKSGTPVKYEITKEQAQFFEEFIISMSRFGEEERIFYKKDFVLTEERQVIIKGLQDLFEDYLYDFLMQTDRAILDTSYSANILNLTQEDGRFYIEVHMDSVSYPDV